KRRLVVHFVENSLGELAIDAAVLFPIAGIEARARVRYMAERPKPLVGKTVVITLLFLLAEPDASQRVSRVLGRDTNPAAFIGHLAIRVAAAVRHPGAAACLHHRIECGCEPAGRLHPANFISVVNMDERLAVRQYDKLRASQARSRHLFQPFFSPGHGYLLLHLRLSEPWFTFRARAALSNGRET